MRYIVTLESPREAYSEMEPLYRLHYQEMCEWLTSQGVEYSPYAPRLDAYLKSSDEGWLLLFVLRLEDRTPVGYMQVYLTEDMHNHDKIAKEDALFVLKEHRNGVGKKLISHVLKALKHFDVKRLHVAAGTDLRVTKLWSRMGFKETAIQMTYTF